MDARDVQLSLLRHLLAAPGSNEGWTTFLSHLCDALGGSAASFISHDFTSTQTAISVTARTDPEALAAYNHHWHQYDPWAHSPATARARSGSVISGEMLIRAADLHCTGFHSDFGRHYGIVQCLAGIIEASPRALSCLSINGTARRRPFDEQDAALVASLMTPLQRALEIHRRLSGAELTSVNAAAVLDRLPHGVLLVARNGTVVSTNSAADEILRRRDGLTVERDEVRGATVELTDRLRAAVYAAICSRSGKASDGDVLVILPRPSGRPPLSVVVAALPRAANALAPQSGAAAAIFVSDPDRTPRLDDAVLRSVFDLTLSESKLVRCLVRGSSLGEAARELGLRTETVRSRLKIIFQKTNTHRQADLVRIVLSHASSAL